MRESAFFILTALAEQPAHGYGILREIESLSERRVRLRTSTLYSVLDRLTADGLIAIDREEVSAGRLRRYYRLTPDGRAALLEVAEARRASADRALDRLRGKELGWAS